MKKYFLSGIVIASFVLFSYYYRNFGQSASIGVQLSNNTNTNCPPTSAPVVLPPIRFGEEDDDSGSVSRSNRQVILNPSSAPSAGLGQGQGTTPNTSSNTISGYKNGTFIGDVVDAFYGNIQVQAVVQNGKITDVQFLQYPKDRSTSVKINQQAMPILTSEAIQVQSANVNIVSGATYSSQAFAQSLQSALVKAKI
jgi:uncharacterized protein with FMN-binding domain